jgi:hypothetical protein
VDRAAQQYFDLVASPGGDVLIAEAAQLNDFTPKDLQGALEQVRKIEAEVEEAVDAIEPPEQIAELHHFLFDFGDDFISAQEALAARAGPAADWEDLSESPEMATYRAALAEDKQECADSQTEMNAITERHDLFTDAPWIPGELNEIVEVVLGMLGIPRASRGRLPPATELHTLRHPQFTARMRVTPRKSPRAAGLDLPATTASSIPTSGAENVRFPRADPTTRRSSTGSRRSVG